MSDRRHLTVFGATGFTARIILKELVASPKRWPTGFKWALAGRNRNALEELRLSIFPSQCSGSSDSNAISFPDIIVADVFDQESLNSMARTTNSAPEILHVIILKS
jgi:uncharacterized protein YbjT (DUF2867 family)